MKSRRQDGSPLIRTARPLLTWLLIAVAGFLAGGWIIGSLSSDMDPSPSAESMRTEATIRRLTGVSTSLLIQIPETPGKDGADTAARTEALRRQLIEIDAVHSVTTSANTPEPGAFRSANGRNSAVVVAIRAGATDDQIDQIVAASRIESKSAFGPSVVIAGPAIVDEALGTAAENDLLRADAIAIPIVLILLGFALKTRRAIWWGLVSVVATVAGSLLLLAAATLVTDVSVFAVNVVTMFAVGLTVDYTLLIATEFQRQLHIHRYRPTPAIEAARITRLVAGRTVAYSGFTVAAALVGLLLFREPVLRSLGLGGIGATLTAIAVANTLLPALLQRSNYRVGQSTTANQPTANSDGYRFRRLARKVTNRPGLAITASLVGLGILAAPALGITSAGLDIRALPKANSARQAVETVANNFAALTLPTTEILVGASTADAQTIDLIARLNSWPNVTSVDDVMLSSTQTLITVRAPTAVHPALVDSIRKTRGPLSMGVTGEAAEDADFMISLRNRLPFAVAMMATLTLLLLWLLTASLVIPIKAVLVSMASLAASVGVLVWGFQDGHLASLLGFTPVGGLDPVIVLLACIFAFGLSTDYEVFLLSSIKQHRTDTATTREAIEQGVGRTGRIITVAAALIIVVFIGFSAGDLIIIKQLGVALAAAILIDATIVRLVLVPATLALFGTRNWWQPDPLRRLHRRLTAAVPILSHDARVKP